MYNQWPMENTKRILSCDGPRKNVTVDCDMMIDKKTGKLQGYDYTYTYVNFIVFIDLKVTCSQVEELNALHDIDTLYI